MTTFENHTHTQVHAQRVAVEAARELGGERERKKERWGKERRRDERLGRREIEVEGSM